MNSSVSTLRNNRVCSDHFEDRMFCDPSKRDTSLLKKTATPTLMPHLVDRSTVSTSKLVVEPTTVLHQPSLSPNLHVEVELSCAPLSSDFLSSCSNPVVTNSCSSLSTITVSVESVVNSSEAPNVREELVSTSDVRLSPGFT